MRLPKNRTVFWNLAKSSLPQKTQNIISNQILLTRFSSTKKSSKQPNLLPYHVLPLEETLTRFMTSVEPFLTSEELKHQTIITQEFLKKEGKDLQILLENTGNKERNWLAHRWLKAAYLQYRSPVTVFVSPGMTFPKQQFNDAQSFIEYTSKVIFGLGEFNNMVQADKIPIVKMGKLELDNSQFGKVFGTCRIPKRGTDDIVYNPCADYVVVIYKNHFYKLHIYDSNGELIATDSLAEELKNIIAKEPKFGVPYGVLSTDSRDNWAEAYEHLSNYPRNRDAIKSIQGAMFTVSLDECTKTKEGEDAEELILSLIHGNGSKVNSGNRWMDKTIQLVLNPNGNVGFTYEHSPAEGQPIAMMMDYVVKKIKEDPNFGKGGSTNTTPAEKIEFCPLNECIEQWLVIAQKNLDKLVNNLQMKVLKFDGYGKDFIKKQRLGPDSFIQIALQLAFYRMHAEPAAQYESAHLRIFDGGRTETIRSCSNESVDFCRSMQNVKFTDQDRAEKLRKAVAEHQLYAKLALQGKGVDRHLFGLKLMALENGLPIPEFFSSPGFIRSSNFRVSTSQVATKYEAFMGYGPLVDDGYGCCYNPREHDIILAISSWRYCEITDPLKFSNILEKSFYQMRAVLENCSDTTKNFSNPKSKL
ncbi:carnitine O-acetyltransferase-like [Drosophila bipectinata]|uniref:carnitine O-acetyltransferase-like n=1 Tax=Drosophila bipectinata TaxID=42026 RepID=UPI001C8A8E13|nr:carnitine O-acetyltransferase-like isoform X2 [Drosophila bipectinata]XP_017109312.2 carnitine O-acetyltransferase-like isoform X2 [Drosophila bipectinata]XP_017109313.2 carnitine O-acetyltransferase-like isoform X2 [Drosophila bipectinata]XP_017109314.2 carnitine O-acetyltransferase-like isoform X2 [Drosophila bipectinata]